MQRAGTEFRFSINTKQKWKWVEALKEQNKEKGTMKNCPDLHDMMLKPWVWTGNAGLQLPQAAGPRNT